MDFRCAIQGVLLLLRLKSLAEGDERRGDVLSGSDQGYSERAEGLIVPAICEALSYLLYFLNAIVKPSKLNAPCVRELSQKQHPVFL